jgi:hypothetical protein
MLQNEWVSHGATSHNAIAAKLNERNVRTAHMYRSEQSFTLSTARASPLHNGQTVTSAAQVSCQVMSVI